MKTLKITLVAICSIVLLTGVSALNTVVATADKTNNKEVKQAEIKLLATSGIKKDKAPSQG
ncbi:hypothetical protein [Olleya sp. Bg11-27]|uniref:hypothetical protein n=1 Tax=Olleya sp. Bg11-27 TaxID=2058135 RepID=UPI000C30BC75|nr:hypothetical protein [Olleya sp. Bg11-27]AUC74386.1 hypothetical protein CW732_01300 [Olleya sp. Bg11-27]AUC74388.1 hypothetical protein CW732_01310 [Olleya sp. Bg11-27]